MRAGGAVAGPRREVAVKEGARYRSGSGETCRSTRSVHVSARYRHLANSANNSSTSAAA